MSAMSAQQRAEAARSFARAEFKGKSSTATVDHDEIVTAMGAVDNFWETLPTASLDTTKTTLENFVLALDSGFASSLTASQQQALITAWGAIKFGTG